MGQGADGDVIHAGAGDLADVLQGYAAARFEFARLVFFPSATASRISAGFMLSSRMTSTPPISRKLRT